MKKGSKMTPEQIKRLSISHLETYAHVRIWKCDFCQNEFEREFNRSGRSGKGRLSRNKYCSQECKKEGHKLNFNKTFHKANKIKRCNYCKKEFEDTTTNSRRLYCSRSCSAKLGVRSMSESQREHRNAWKMEWARKNPERVREISRRTRIKNRETFIAASVKWRSKKRIEDPYFRKIDNLRRRLIRAMRDYAKTGKIMTSREYGIDYEKIISHLMKNRPEGVSDSELFDFRKWHIDHIHPLSKFDLNDPEEVKKAFAPENHQWLTAKENIRKGNKIIKGY